MQTEEMGARVYAELVRGKDAAGAQRAVCQVGACVRGNVSSAGEARWNRFGLLTLPVPQGAPAPFPKNRRSLQPKITHSKKRAPARNFFMPLAIL